MKTAECPHARRCCGRRTLSDAPFMTSPTEKRAIVERRRFRALMKSLKDGLDEIR